MRYPGYNYLGLGPFVEITDEYIRNNPPINALDAAALKHDLAYSRIIRESGSYFEAYGKFSTADAKFLKDIRHIKSFPASIARKIFKIKRNIAKESPDAEATYVAMSERHGEMWEDQINSNPFIPPYPTSPAQPSPIEAPPVQEEHKESGSNLLKRYFDPLNNLPVRKKPKPNPTLPPFNPYATEAPSQPPVQDVDMVIHRHRSAVIHPTYYNIDLGFRSVFRDIYPVPSVHFIK